MKFINCLINGEETLTVKNKEGLVKINKLLDMPSISIDDVINDNSLIEKINNKLSNEEYELLDEKNLTILPSVPRPGKVICIGKNYAEHAKETNDDIPLEPIVFSKFSDTVAGHLENIPLPKMSSKVDYEAELAVVINDHCTEVPENQAMDYVFGYSIANDLSARDLQFVSGQWLIGKTNPKFAPIGPSLVTKNEIDDVHNLDISLYLNGDNRQSSNTKYMIFSIPYLIHYLSKFMELRPGDVILTGTPEGVILGLPENKQDWLKAGDEMTVEIDGLGTLTNTLQ